MTDMLHTTPLQLDIEANTKRLILRSIAKNFDVLGFNCPIFNRSRLFMHRLQCRKDLGWDTKLNGMETREWRNIAKQINSSSPVEVKRFVGRRDGKFRLIAFTDASKTIYGSVLYLQDVDSLEVNFICAKNRIVNTQLETKSVPSLEFQALVLGTEMMMDYYEEVSGSKSVIPLSIVEMHLYTDSMISLNWIQSYTHKFDKMQRKRSVFIMNRLNSLVMMCEKFAVTFHHVAGVANPADQVTREVSAKQLAQTCYIDGPSFLCDPNEFSRVTDDMLSVTVPNPLFRDTSLDTTQVTLQAVDVQVGPDHLIPVDRFSSLRKLVRVQIKVRKFINLVQCGANLRKPHLFSNVVHDTQNINWYMLSLRHIIRIEQSQFYSEVFDYFKKVNPSIKDMPNLVGQLNLYIDQEGLIRLKSKCSRGKDPKVCYVPILLPKSSQLTKLIAYDRHDRMCHAGKYTVISELRKRYWIPCVFSFIKKLVRDCTICRRRSEKPLRLNQSPYRDFRISPPSVPYRYLFCDYFGPYTVKFAGQKVQVWILCFTCLWSRAINLKICIDLTVDNFLRALQLHIFDHGTPELVLSDSGSQLVAGSNVVTDYIKDTETQNFFQENNIKSTNFQQYYKGNSALGGLVACEKMCCFS